MGNWNVYSFYRALQQDKFAGQAPMDRGFERRLHWVLACANIAEFRIHHFDYYKTNTSKYFIQGMSIFVPERMPYGFTMVSKPLQKPTCYYIGQWPNYWNTTNKRIVFAHDLMTYEAYSIGQSGEMPGVTYSEDETKEIQAIQDQYGKEMMIHYLYPETLPEEDRKMFFSIPNGIGTLIDREFDKIAFFKTKQDILESLRIQYAVVKRQFDFSNCIKKVFPAPTKAPQYKIIDPEGAKDFPGIPLEELQKPVPEKPMGPAPIEGKVVFRLTIYLSVIKASLLNGWDLIVTIEEIKE